MPPMEDVRLTPTSYVVLGLIESMQPATAYDLKVAAKLGVANLWALPHTQLYSECARLAEAGLLDEEREPGGRRRRIYRLAAPGASALDDWRADPTPTAWELRDAGLLKLFFGSDPRALAAEQLKAHRRRLAEYEDLSEQATGMAPGMALALQAGIGHEREYLRFWTAVAEGREP
jgi:DNA-binding PadR family transcriptional regulator